MRTVQETAIHIPPHLERLADVAVADPVVHSVVLYGSRSVGRHRADSDWDVALVTEGGTKPSRTVMGEGWGLSPKHGFTVLSENEMATKKDVYASLASEIALGVVLRGAVYDIEDGSTARRKFGTNTEEARSSYAALLVTMWKFIREDVMNVTVCKKSDYTVSPIGLGGASADAAERVVKLVTLAHGLPFQASRDVHELAEGLPDEWRNRLKALHGETKRLHEADYGMYILTEDEAQELCEDTERRLRLTMDVANDLLGMPTPLIEAGMLRLRAMLANPAAVKEVDLMVDECSTTLPDLVEHFTTVRGDWLARLARTSVERE